MGLLVAGLVIGYLVSLGTNSTTYKATAQVYLGQPLAPDGAAPVSSAPTSLGLVSNLVTSESVVRSVAGKSGLKPGRLRGHIATKPILGITAAKVGTPAPLMAITVTGSPPRKIADAANRLAGVVDRRGLRLHEREDREAEGADRLRRHEHRAEQRPLLDRPAAAGGDPPNNSLAATERLLLLANINTTLVTVEQRLGQLESDRLDAQQFLSLAENVERARITSPAVATKTAGPNSRTGAAVGGLIGLIVGILAALLWDPVARAARTRAPKSDVRGQERGGGRTGPRRGGAARSRRSPGSPDFVDRVYVVDDASRDATAERARAAAAADQRIEVVVHERNRGVGAAIVSGYERAIADRIDVTVRDGGRQPDGPGRPRGARRARSPAARSTTRRPTASSPARRGS